MEVCVVGTGYVGLVAGTCFADSGRDVVCVDKDAAKIEALNAGKVPIYEPGLAELVARNRAEGRLTFTTDLAAGVQKSKLVFIAVGTPQGDDGRADKRFVLEVARGIGRTMNGYKIIVDKSTVPVGTAEEVRAAVRSETSHPFDVVSNPEFLKEGDAIQDFMKPDRVVIGTDKPEVAEVIKELYAPFVRTDKPILVMDIPSAEMTKYAANALLATKISFMNEIARVCERVGADVTAVRKGIGSDSRIGPHFLFPGLGYGGSCFPKDVQAVIRTGADHGVEMEILDAVERVNQSQRQHFIDKVMRHFGNDLSGRTLAVWGLSFKPRTDDMRMAPSVTIIEAFLQAGAIVRAHDPEAMPEAKRFFGDRVVFCDTNYAAIEGADAVVIVTEWNEFRRPDFERVRASLKQPVIFDGRNLYNKDEMQALGFSYHSIGR
ncbi:MAG: UDP-glucose/GDP-mannose dehydrogenase family protein [Deltaproteobacteria bacterium]|nr:UDP-glucose/GDP-mannose dehydrogenase family protein [Deltaproteobacteria bacterium]